MKTPSPLPVPRAASGAVAARVRPLATRLWPEGIERLEERRVLAITAVLGPGGILAVTGSPGDDSIEVRISPTDPSVLEVDDEAAAGTADFTFAAAAVKQIRVLLGDGDDMIIFNDANGVVSAGARLSIDGGRGDDLLIASTAGQTRAEILGALARLQTGNSFLDRAATLLGAGTTQLTGAVDLARLGHEELVAGGGSLLTAANDRVSEAQALLNVAHGLGHDAKTALLKQAGALLKQASADFRCLQDTITALGRTEAAIPREVEETPTGEPIIQTDDGEDDLREDRLDQPATHANGTPVACLDEALDENFATLTAGAFELSTEAFLARVLADLETPAAVFEARVEQDLQALADAFTARADAYLNGAVATYLAGLDTLATDAESLADDLEALLGPLDSPAPPPAGPGAAAKWDFAPKTVHTVKDLFGSNIFIGTPLNDLMVGGLGTDLMFGLGGDDRLDGNGGRDLLFGGRGNDALLGKEGSDILVGGAGNDALSGGTGDITVGAVVLGNLMIGSAGSDCLLGGAHADVQLGRADDDEVRGAGGIDFQFGGAGHDLLDGAGGQTFTLGGQKYTIGNLQIGGSGDDLVHGGVGIDVQTGNAGLDDLDGAAEIDLQFGGTEADIITGGAGGVAFTVTVSGAKVPVRFGNLQIGGDGADKIVGGTDRDLQFGLADNDTIAGGHGISVIGLFDDVMFGGTGDDTMDGGRGRDVMFGFSGADTMQGDDGTVVDPTGINDLMFGGADHDTMSGGASSDLLIGFTGDDVLSGGDGILDVLLGGVGHDTIAGNKGNDLAIGGPGNDELKGGAGFIDVLLGRAGDDRIFGEAGIDLALGGLGEDEIRGGDALDMLFGGAGSDRLFGDASTDVLFGNEECDALEGGTGFDLLLGNADADAIRGNTDSDVLFGGGSADLLHGDADTDLLFGGDGDDTLFGDDGHDILFGNKDDDKLLGGAGLDALFGLDGVDKLFGDDEALSADTHGNLLVGGHGNDVIFGGDQGDVIFGGLQDDFISGRGGADFVWGDKLGSGSGADTIYGDAGNDRLRGGDGNDALDGGLGDDRMFGGLGDDLLYGREGHDKMWGDRQINGPGGADTMDGGPGNDRLRGGPGDDRLYGGPDKDNIKGNKGTNTIYQNTSYGGTLGEPPCSELRGLKWYDFNRNGTREAGEPGLLGVTIYLDANNNGQLDAGEKSTLTMADDPGTCLVDETGQYRFTDLVPGSYIVREIVPAGTVLSSSAEHYSLRLARGQVVENLDFGNATSIRFGLDAGGIVIKLAIFSTASAYQTLTTGTSAGVAGNPATGAPLLDALTLAQATNAFTTASHGNNLEDGWGIATVTGIFRASDPVNPIWTPATSGAQITVFFHGQQDFFLEQTTADIQTVAGLGLQADWYYQDAADGTFTAFDPGAGPAGRGSAASFPTVTDSNGTTAGAGVPFLRTVSTPGFLSGAGSLGGVPTEVRTSFSLSSGTGEGTTFLSVSGGTNGEQFDHDSFAAPFLAGATADLQVEFTFATAGATPWLYGATGTIGARL